MKSDEVRKILQGMIEIIDLYPDKNMAYILNDIKQLKVNKSTENQNAKEKTKIPKATDADQKALIDQIFDNIDSLKITELVEKLNSADLFPNMEYLRYFAGKIGVELASRQSKANSIHTIKSHVDRMRIDKTISKRND